MAPCFGRGRAGLICFYVGLAFMMVWEEPRAENVLQVPGALVLLEEPPTSLNPPKTCEEVLICVQLGDVPPSRNLRTDGQV